MKKSFSILLTLACIVLTCTTTIRAETIYTDENALQGVDIGKGLFDINLTHASKLELYLSVIKKTHADFIRQGSKPKFVIAFRGASVRLISSETWSFSKEDQQSLAKSASIIKELQELGIALEACSIATDLFKVDNSTLLPGVQVVGNTFVSLISYQAKGYSLIPIQ